MYPEHFLTFVVATQSPKCTSMEVLFLSKEQPEERLSGPGVGTEGVGGGVVGRGGDAMTMMLPFEGAVSLLTGP